MSTVRTGQRPRVTSLLGLVAAVGVLAGCGLASGSASVARITGDASSQLAAATSSTCKDGKPIVTSIAPGGITAGASTWPADSTMEKIFKRGRLVVGTSGDAQLWGATDPKNGDLDGYDVDLAGAVAAALKIPADHIDYKVLALFDRQAALNRSVDDGGVDIVAERMTITCDRWQGTSAASPAINFSSPYYYAGQQQLLVRSDSTATGIKNFSGQPVCGVTGSSSLAGIADSDAKKVTANSAGQCLVMFQEGEAVAVTGDDTTLAGLQSQDQFSKVVGPPAADVPYGLGLPPGDTAFTSFVNAVLAGQRSGSGTNSLSGLYDRWMKPQVGGSAPATQAPYGRNVSALAQKTS